MDLYTILHIGLLVVLVFASAFFSGSETAFFSLQRFDVEGMKEQGRKGAALVDELLSKPRELIVTILIGNELVNISIAAVSASLVVRHMQGYSELEKTMVSTLFAVGILLLFGEITPKTIAIRFNRFYAITAAPILKVVMKLIAPLRLLALGITHYLTSRLGMKESSHRAPFDEERLLSLIEEQAAEGIIDEEEKELITNVLTLDDIPVRRIMQPLDSVYMVSSEMKLADLLEEIRKQRYSRIPVWMGSKQNITGVIYTKDLLEMLARSDGELPGTVRDLMRPIETVSPDSTADQVLRKMRKKKVHIALVKDSEKDEVYGIITLEDVLEEIVGEIYDEKEQLRK